MQPSFIHFSLLVLFCIPSTICAIYIIYYAIRVSSFRRRFQNQTLIILIVIVLFDIIFNIPTTFSFYARGYALSQSESFCYIWQTGDYIFTASILWCKAIFTLERYVLVFHPNRLGSYRQKIIFHYIPLISIQLYLILFYIFTTIFYQCISEVKFSELLCGIQCLDKDGSLPTFNWLFNILFPVFIIIFGSLILLIRVLWTRREMQRNLRNWSKNLKMIIQLLGIAILYIIVWLPLVITTLIKMSGNTNSSIDIAENYFYFIASLCEMSVPIVSLFLSPELMPKMHRRLQPNTINIASVTVSPYSKY